MELTVLLCTDGSELAREALAAGLAVLGPAERVVLATVTEPLDPMLVTGTGIAGGVVSPDEFDRIAGSRDAEARNALEETQSALGLTDAEVVTLDGAPGSAICDFASSLPASVIVMGSRGRGGLRRAVLGSVSDHVVRNAPCPVVITGPA
jgi:nucleotide-binding universal stress UspA family protein